MSKMYLIFSHKLSEDQINEAKSKFSIKEFIYLSSELQTIWSNVPPNCNDLDDWLSPLIYYLKNNICENDYVLIQGEFGSTYKVVNLVKSLRAKALYATTLRETIETTTADGVLKQSIFKHCLFRFYS